MVPLSPSVTLGLSMARVGAASSSVMVPVPVPVPMVALVALLSVTTTVSFASSVLSPATVTATVCDAVVPAAKVSVPGASVT